MIWMEHPGLGPDRKQLVPKKAFVNVWSRNGWVKTTPPEPKPTLEEELELVSQDLEDWDYPEDDEEQE